MRSPMRRRAPLAFVLLCALGAFTGVASADGPHHVEGTRPAPARAPGHARRATHARIADSRSVGWPWQGRLVNGVELAESASVHHAGEYAPTGHFYGTRELVGLLE